MLNENEGTYKTLLRTGWEMKEEVEESKSQKADQKIVNIWDACLTFSLFNLIIL